MPLTPEAAERVAYRLFLARTQGDRKLVALDAPLDEHDGYAVQDALFEHHVAAGSTLAGYKVGLTSPAARASYGAGGPAWGFLLTSSIVTEADAPELDPAREPKVEAELAFLIDRDLPNGEVTVDDVLAATGRVLLAAELVETRWAVPAGLGGLIADDVSNSAVVLGPVVPLSAATDDGLEAVVRSNGRETRGTAANVLGSPAQAVAWLATELSRNGRRLQAGHLVMSGSFGIPLPIDPPDDVVVDFGDLGRLHIEGRNG